MLLHANVPRFIPATYVTLDIALLSLLGAYIVWLYVTLGTEKRRHKFCLKPVARHHPSVFFVSVLATCFVCWHFFNAVFVPAQAWDLLASWVPLSLHLEPLVQKPPLAIDTLDSAQWHWLRHPPTLALMIARELSFHHLGLQLPVGAITWGLVKLSLLLVMIGSGIAACGSAMIGTVLSLLWLNLPLVENHLLIWGYPEILLTTVLIAATGSSIIGLQHNSKPFIYLGLSFACLGLLVKNIGVAYPVILAANIFFVTCLYKLQRPMTRCLALVVSILMAAVLPLAISQAIVILSGANEVRLSLGGRLDMLIAAPGVAEIVDIELHSKLLNLSFGLSLPILALCVVTAARNYIFKSQAQDLMLVSTVVMSFALFFILSIFTDVGLRHALPTADTSHSRFAVTYIPLLHIGCAVMCRLTRLNS